MAAHAPGLSLVAHVLATSHCASKPGHLHVTVEGTPDWTVTCPWSCPKAAGWAPASSLCTWHPLLPQIRGARCLGRPQIASRMVHTRVSRPVGHSPCPVRSRVAISKQFGGAQLRSKVSQW